MVGRVVALILLGSALSTAPVVTSRTDAATSSVDRQTTEYKEGWKDGWAEGWKYIKGEFSLPPYAPYPPYPEYGKDTYKGGYNSGFIAGMREANRKK